MGDAVASLRKKVVVTGASGHIGYHLALELCRRGFDVHLPVRSVNSNVVHLATQGAQVALVDFARPATFASSLKDVDCLFHAAAENTAALVHGTRVLNSTMGLTRTLVETALAHGTKTIVYTSSVVVLARSRDAERLITVHDRLQEEGDLSPYIRGKCAAEDWCRQCIDRCGADIRRVYPSWVVGPRDVKGTPPHQVIRRYLQKGQPFSFAGGISIADVREVARGHVETWLRGRPCSQYVLGGDNITFGEFFRILAELSGAVPPKITLPRGVVVAGCRVLKMILGLFGKAPPLDPEYAKRLLGYYSWYDSSAAMQDLGYRVPAARESLQIAVQGEIRRLAKTYELGRQRSLSLGNSARTKEEKPPLLITGVPGWLGNRLVDVLINGNRRGELSPRRMVRLLVEPRLVPLLDLPENFQIVPGDICDPDAVSKAVAGVHTVFHLAGAIYPKRIRTLYRVNTEGTINLATQCIRQGVRRILFMGTDAICGHGSAHRRVFEENTSDQPYRHYGRSKWLAEDYLMRMTHQGFIDATSLRGFWFFGPFAPERQHDFLQMLGWSRQLVFGSGKNLRSISHVDNTVAAFLQAEDNPATFGKWYWIGDAKPDYAVDDIYRSLCQAAGHSFRPLYIPRIACAMCRVVDTLMNAVGFLHPTIHALGKFSFDIAGKVDAARRDFGYEPDVSLLEDPEAFLETTLPEAPRLEGTPAPLRRAG